MIALLTIFFEEVRKDFSLLLRGESNSFGHSRFQLGSAEQIGGRRFSFLFL